MSEKIPNTFEDGPKNRIREMLRDEEVQGRVTEEGRTLAERRISALPKNLPEEMREKRIKKIQNYFVILRQLRDRMEEQWAELNKEKIKDNELTPEQVESRGRYVESVEPRQLSKMLEQWKEEWEEAATMEKDKNEKQDLYNLVDAASELDADMVNW